MTRNIDLRKTYTISKTMMLFKSLSSRNRKLDNELKELNNKKILLEKDTKEALKNYNEILNKIAELSEKYKNFIRNSENLAEDQFKDEFFELIQLKVQKNNLESMIDTKKSQYKRISQRINEIENIKKAQ